MRYKDSVCRVGKRKRVLVITPTLRTGSWICIMEMAKKLSRDYDILVLGSGKVGRQKIPLRIVRIPYIDHDGLFGYIAYSNAVSIFLFNLPLLFLWLLAMIIHRPDILITNGLLPALFLNLPAKILGIRLVCSHHGYIGCLSDFTIKFAKIFAKFIDLVIVNSEISKQDISQLIEPRKIIVVEHWTEEIFFSPKEKLKCKAEFNFNDKFIVLYVGSIDRAKRFEPLIKAMQHIEDSRDILFLFAGIGKDIYMIKELEKKHKNVRYLGHIYDREVLSKLYACADVLWSYADETYIAKPAIEALASGVPIIIPNMVAAYCKEKQNLRVKNDLIPEDIGWIIDINDIDGIESLIISLKDNGINADRKSNCIKYARKKHGKENNEIIERKFQELVKGLK